MQVLDRTGVGTLWSICKTKFALAGHTHNSLAAVGNEQISATAYGSGLHFKPYYSSGGPTTYGNILEYTSTNTGGGQLAMEWTGSQTKSDGTDSNVGRVYYRSKRDCVNGWTKWMTLAYTNDIPTKLSQLTNDKGFVTGSVSGNTVTINGASTTWTNTWRGIQNNLTSSSTSDSLSANQGRVLKGLIDGKANSSHTHSWSQISGAPATSTRWPSWGEVTSKPDLKNWSETKSYIDSKLSSMRGGAIAMIDWKDPLINGDAFSTTRASIELYYGNNYLNFKKFYASSITVTYKFEQRNTLPGASFIFYRDGDWNRPQSDKDVLIELMGYNADKYCTLAYVENQWCEDYVTYYIIGVKLKENCIFRCINKGNIISYVTLKNDTPYVCDSQGNILT